MRTLLLSSLSCFPLLAASCLSNGELGAPVAAAVASEPTTPTTEAFATGHGAALIWSSRELPTESIITGGPWTLEQSAAGLGLPSAGYCVAGVQQRNPGAERMQPYYFPFIVGHGEHLQGYFDYRPKDIDEAVVAAVSDDAGRSWTFEQQALELTTACPPSEDKTLGNDDGQGHPFTLTLGGVTRLYTLDRSAANIDEAGLVVHVIDGAGDLPLAATPAGLDAGVHTTGLFNPDGIIGMVDGRHRATILYLQKQLKADLAFPAAQQCAGAKANHDVVTPRLAETTDGVHFTDLGAVSGLNDSADVTATGTRFVGPRGTIVRVAGGGFGLFFSGGGCIDNDSDAFHYIGYAESNDLRHWHVVNGIDHPIASVAPVTIDGVRIPATTPVVGNTLGWFSGRVYSPSVTLLGDRRVTLNFAGYHTIKPKDAPGDYRTIGRVTLHASRPLDDDARDGDGR